MEQKRAKRSKSIQEPEGSRMQIYDHRQSVSPQGSSMAQQGDTTMFGKIVLSAAIVFGTALAAPAMAKQGSHHSRPVAHHQVLTGAYQAYGLSSVRRIRVGGAGESGARLIQDRDYLETIGYAPERIW
jgi:hypothetical protein